MMEVVAKHTEKLGVYLSPNQIQQLEVYYRLLVEWNQRINLTSITAYEEVQAKHFLDSLTLIPVLQEMTPSPCNSPVRVVDIGAGAGFPGVPLKIALPEVQLVLIESTAKKAAFLRHLTDALGLTGVEVRIGRAEQLAHQPDLREGFDFCLARAIAALPTLLEITLPFVRPGGFFIAHKSAEIAAEIAASANALRILGGQLKQVREVQLNSILSPRVLVIVERVSQSLPIYPRRPGMPAKRPL
ncbi:MAG: 16S rRNA (guanine(527)-N(7))-methyltransferase RsmG [Dehalococcoidia bacterium]|nr:16S rRNA (guanine(527)-N(7))-methyltransferase RsmG [Dehalococcoidia bacterium]